MDANDNCGLAIFKWMVTIISFTIALPCYFHTGTKVAFVLTSCVFIISKFIDNIEGIGKYKTQFHTIFCIIGSLIGALSIGVCFYFFAVIFNETSVEVQMEEIVYEVDNSDIDKKIKDEKVSKQEKIYFVSNVERDKYPLLKNDIFYFFLFITLLFYIGEETIFGGCQLVKYITTKKRIARKKNKAPMIMNIDL